MISEPQHQDQNADRTADSTSKRAEHVSVRRKAAGPTSGVTPRSNTSEAWEQLRNTASSTTHQINDFMARNTTSRGERDKTLRQVAERGRGEAGRGLRALAEAAGKLADLVDGTSGSKGQHADSPRIVESKDQSTRGDQGR